MVSGKTLKSISKSRYFVLLLFIFALLIRLPGINRPEIADEGKAIRAVNKDFSGIVEQLSNEDSQPPLYYFMLKIWGKISNTYSWLRFFSVILGALICVIIYKIGRSYFKGNVGLYTYILSAISPLLINLSQYLRPYCLGILETVICFWLLIKIIKETDNRRTIILFLLCGLCLLASLYTFYYSALVIISLNVFCILYFIFRSRKKLLYWIFVQVLMVLFYLPWIPYYSKQMEQLANEVIWHYHAIHQAKIGFYIGQIHIGEILKALLSVFQVSDIYALSIRFFSRYPKMLLFLVACITPILICCITYRGFRKLYQSQNTGGVTFLMSSIIFIPLLLSIARSVLGDLGLLSPLALNIRYFGQSVVFFTFFLAAYFVEIKKKFFKIGILFLASYIFLAQINFLYAYPFNIYKKLFTVLQKNRDIILLVSFPSSLDKILDPKTARQLRQKYEDTTLFPENITAQINKIKNYDQFYLLSYNKAEYVLLHSEKLKEFKRIVKNAGFTQRKLENISDFYSLRIFEQIKEN